MAQECICRFKVRAHCRDVKWRTPHVTASVNLGTTLEKKAHSIVVSPKRDLVQRGVATGVAVVNANDTTRLIGVHDLRHPQENLLEGLALFETWHGDGLVKPNDCVERPQ